MKLLFPALAAAILMLFHNASAIATEDQKKYKDDVFEFIKPHVLTYFDKYRYIDRSKETGLMAKPVTFSFVQLPTEIPETSKVERHRYQFCRFLGEKDAADEIKTELFELIFELTEDSGDMVILFENKVVTARKVIQYILPIEKPFARNSIKRTVTQYLDRLDQTINYFEVFLEDIRLFQEIFNVRESAGKSKFKLESVTPSPKFGGDANVKFKHFDIAQETARMSKRDDYNNRLFVSQAGVSDKIKKTEEELKTDVAAVYSNPAYVMLVLTPTDDKFMQFGNVEMFCFYHPHRNVFTTILKSNYFTFESDFNIMTRGFIIENLEHTLKRVEQELYANLLSLQSNEIHRSLDEEWEEALGSNFESAGESKQFFHDYQCRSSANLGMSLCKRVANGDGSWRFRAVYAGISNEWTKPVLTSEKTQSEEKVNVQGENSDEGKEVVDKDSGEKLKVDAANLPFGVYYIERNFPSKTMYDVSVFMRAAVEDFMLLGDGLDTQLESGLKKSQAVEKSEGKEAGTQSKGAVYPDLKQLQMRTYLESPRCLTPFSTELIDGKLILPSTTEKLDWRYYLNFSFKENNVVLSWRKTIEGKTLLETIPPWQDFDRMKKEGRRLKLETEYQTIQKVERIRDKVAIELVLPEKDLADTKELLKKYKPVI